MKYASSIRYGGQLIEAAECDYNSYKHLGLLCPECKDPVLLRGESTRSQHGKDVKVNAHFAHFPGKDPTLVAQCENRVSKYTPKELQKMAAQSKGQRLRLVQRWFWTVFIEHQLNFFDEKDNSDFASNKEMYRKKVKSATNSFSLVHKEEVILAKRILKAFYSFVQTSGFHGFVEACFDEFLKNNQSTTSSYGQASLTRLSKLERRFHVKVSCEVVQFLVSKSNNDLFFSVMSYIFYFCHNNERLTAILIESDLPQLIQVLSKIFIEFQVSIPWTEEFTRLQKEETVSLVLR